MSMDVPAEAWILGSEPIRRTLTDQVLIRLHQAILGGEFPAGTWLRIQDLARRFDTSSMPVREALRKLDSLGLVEVFPHRGARVAALTMEDLVDSYRARRGIETALVELAAQHFTAENGAVASGALRRHEAVLAAGDMAEARQAHTDFHFRIYQASGSRWLLRSLDPVWQNCERYRFASPDDERARALSHSEHAEILAACAANDSARAQVAVQTHLDGALERIRRAMKVSGESHLSGDVHGMTGPAGPSKTETGESDDI